MSGQPDRPEFEDVVFEKVDPAEAPAGISSKPPVYVKKNYKHKPAARLVIGLMLTGGVILFFGVGTLGWLLEDDRDLEQLGVFLAPLVTLVASVLTYYYARNRA